MSRPKKHHLVPQTYLKRFTNDDGKLWTYLREQLRQIPDPQSVQNVCAQTYFYDLPKSICDLFQVEQAWELERQLAEIDGNIANTLADTDIKIAIGSHIEGRLREQLFAAVAILHVRTEFMRRRLARILADLYSRQEYKSFELDESQRIHVSQKVLAHLHPHFMGRKTLAGLLDRFYDLTMAIGTAPNGLPLWTSDNPVASIPGIPHPKARDNIPRSARYLFPLSPRYVLVLYQTNEPNSAPAPPPTTYFRLGQRHVQHHNSMQLAQATRHVVSPTQNFDSVTSEMNLESLDVVSDVEFVEEDEADFVLDYESVGRNAIRLTIGDDYLEVDLENERIDHNIG